MDDPNRSIAKRQIARLLGSSSIPFCVLSEDDQLVFANESMGLFVGRSSDSLLGLRCNAEIPADGSMDASLSAFFALPIHWSRSVLKLIPESGRPLSGLDAKTERVDQAFDATSPTSKWFRCLIPLEQQGSVLCVFCPTTQLALQEVVDEQSAITHRMMRTNRSKYTYLDNLWYLQGPSPGARRALDQVQLAIANPSSLTVFGQFGSGRSWLAQSIQSQRRKINSEGKFSINDSMIRIDCKLMDNELLTSMLESIVESQNSERTVTTILLDNLEGLSDECVCPVLSFLIAQDQIICLATCDPSAVSTRIQNHALWGELFSRTGILRVDLPSLADRLEDIPILVSAWFASRPKPSVASCEISDTFLDALAAYSWPGGIEEFSDSLDHAFKNADGMQLADKDLPVNIRTYVSHVEQSQADESVDLDAILEDVERTMIMRALERFPQNKSSAAKILNISRARLLRRLQQWGIQSESGSVESDDDTPDFNEVK